MPSFACFIKELFLPFENSVPMFDLLILCVEGGDGEEHISWSMSYSILEVNSVAHDINIFLRWFFFFLMQAIIFGSMWIFY